MRDKTNRQARSIFNGSGMTWLKKKKSLDVMDMLGGMDGEYDRARSGGPGRGHSREGPGRTEARACCSFSVPATPRAAAPPVKNDLRA